MSAGKGKEKQRSRIVRIQLTKTDSEKTRSDMRKSAKYVLSAVHYLTEHGLVVYASDYD